MAITNMPLTTTHDPEYTYTWVNDNDLYKYIINTTGNEQLADDFLQVVSDEPYGWWTTAMQDWLREHTEIKFWPVNCRDADDNLDWYVRYTN